MEASFWAFALLASLEISPAQSARFAADDLTRVAAGTGVALGLNQHVELALARLGRKQVRRVDGEDAVGGLLPDAAHQAKLPGARLICWHRYVHVAMRWPDIMSAVVAGIIPQAQ